MLTLLLGPSGSGKSGRLRRELKARAEAGLHSILVVPEQFTSSTEARSTARWAIRCPAMSKATLLRRWPKRCCGAMAARRCPP